MGGAVKRVTQGARNVGGGIGGKIMDLNPYTALSRPLAGKKLLGRDITGGKAPKFDTSSLKASDLTKLAMAEQRDALERSKQLAESQAAARQNVLNQMGLAAQGRGPSLAEAQLKSAQDRNLAQMLATAQAARGTNPALAQRALMQAQSGAGRELAQGAAQARLAERANFLNAASGINQELQQNIGGTASFGAGQEARARQLAELKFQQQQAEAAKQGAVRSAIFGAGGTLIGGYFGGPAGAQIGGQLGSAYAGSTNPGQYNGPTQIGASQGTPFDFSNAKAAFGRLFPGGGGGGGGQSSSGSFSPMTSGSTYMNAAEGGPVHGPGTSTSDSIPAMLSDGEFVVKASEVAKPGVREFLEHLNSGTVHKMAEGGFVAALERAAKNMGDKVKKATGAEQGRKQEDPKKQKFLNIGYKDGGYVDVASLLASQCKGMKRG